MKRKFLSLFTVIAMLISLFSITAFATNNGIVLYDKGGIKITYQDYTVSKYGDFKINILIENNSSKYICVQARNETINGFMISAGLSGVVQVGKKAYADIYFPNFELKENYISTINDAQFSFHISEKEGWDTIDDSELINLSFGGIKLNNGVSLDKGTITTIYNKDGIKISYIDYIVDYGDFIINVLIENNSSKYICVQTRDASINGFMISATMSDYVQVGKKAYADISFPDYKLKENHISTINDAQFSFHIFENGGSGTIDDSQLINLSFDGIKLNNGVSPDKRPITTIYNKDGIKISYIDYNVDDDGDLKVNLFIENNSPKYICVQARNESINGFTISAIMSDDVQVGKKAYADMTFLSYKLKENHISSIKEIEFSLHIFENDDWDRIDDSQLFKITSSGVKGFSPKDSVSDMAPKTVTITIPEFSVKINGNKKNNATAQYPYILYNNITYCPMTYNDSRFLGLASNWSQENGLEITKLSDGSTGNGDSSTRDKINSGKYSAVTASGLIRVNGKIIDNFTEEYPLLVFRDVTYFPLTWRFAVTEFGWDYNYTNETGLTINCLKSTKKK